MSFVSVKQAERVLGEPATEWAKCCFEIAAAFVERGLVDGVAVYGHWVGPVSEASVFRNASHEALGFVRHGWVVLPDGQVCDPTRWVFEAVEPYVYVGPADHYDEGGNNWRARTESAQPPPFDEDDEVLELDQRVLPDSKAWSFVEKLLDLYEAPEPGQITLSQLHWLAHRDPRQFGGHARALYAAIDKLGHGALIPIDNKRMVERGAADAGARGVSARS